MLRMYVVGTLVGLAAAAAPEITADGDDLILAALGGGVYRTDSVGTKLLLATTSDVEINGNNLQDMITASVAQVRAEMSDQITVLSEANQAQLVKQAATDAQLGKVLQEMEEMKGAIADSIGDGATCQQALVDAVLGGTTDITGCPDPSDPTDAGCAAYPAVEHAVVHGHGERKGAVRSIDCDPGYVIVGTSSSTDASSFSGLVVCNSDGQWSDRAKAQCVATTTTTTISSTTTTSTTTIREWNLVYRQKNCDIGVDDGSDVGRSSDDDCFSRFDSIEYFKHPDERTYTFKLLYPTEKRECIFSQTKNPALFQEKDRADDARARSLGFKRISVDDETAWDYSPNTFTGLAKGTQASYLDGEGQGYWFAIGHPGKTFPSLRYDHEVVGTRCGKWTSCHVELWVQNPAFQG